MAFFLEFNKCNEEDVFTIDLFHWQVNWFIDNIQNYKELQEKKIKAPPDYDDKDTKLVTFE